MWLFCFVAITLIVAPSVKPQLLYEDDNIPLMNNPVEMRKMLLSLINTFDRKITENFTKLLARVQNDFQSKLRNQSAELIFVQKLNNENKTFTNTFDRKNSENFTRSLANVQNDFQSKLNNLSAELMSVQNENKEIKSKLLDLTKRQTDAQLNRYSTKPTVEAERNITDIQTDLDAKIKEKFEKLESSIQANLTLRLEDNNALMEDNMEIKRMIGYLNNTQTELNSKVDGLEKLLKEKEKLNYRLAINESSLNDLERKTQVLNDTLHDLQKEGFVMKTKVSTIVTDVQKKADILEQMGSKVTQQSIKVNETLRSIYELKEQEKNRIIYFANVTSTADNMRNELFILKTSLDTLKNQTNYLNVDLTHVNSSVINESQQIEENKMKINGYISQLSYLQMTVKSQETMLQNLQNAVENVGSLPSRCNDSQKPISCEKGVAKVTRISVIADGIRLVNGSSWNEGRVEVYESGGWGSVCSSEWDTMDASVVCKVMGFKYGVVITSGLFGLGGGPVQMTNVSCDGSESSIFGCLYNRTKECPTNQTAGVVCTNANPLRLVNGRTEAEGRVEIYTENSRGRGEWRTVSDRNWGNSEAHAVCQILGFPGHHTIPRAGYHFGQGTGEICLEDVKCNGTELSLLDCHYQWNSNCSHTGDAGVSCLTIRLMEGYDESEGRVEVLIDNQWGTVCDDNWGQNEASVVCRSLGLPSANAVAKRSAYFGHGNSEIILNGLNCSGGENDIQECSRTQSGLEKCGHENDAGVRCLQIRLVNKPGNKVSGMVEVYIKNEWGKVCGDNWTNKDSQVVCRHLGYPRHTAYPLQNNFFGQNPGRIWINNVHCLGGEQTLLNCNHSTNSRDIQCTSRRAAGVNCAPLTLVGGPSDREGRVEVYTDQQWGTVCDTHWGDQEARVVCENLGYFGHHAIPRRNSFFGGGNGSILMADVHCEGNVSSLLDCRHQVAITTNCSHNNDAGVSCLPVRLVGGQNDREGRVEVYMNHVWGTVCDDDWDHDDAQVVCQSLGFPNFTGVARAAAYFGQGSGPILLDNVRCNGNEVDIRNCSYTTNVNCGHSEDAGVICVPLRLVDGKIGKEGRVEVYMNNHWGTVCNTNWGQNEAQVVCENIGYGRFNAVPRQSAFFGEGIGDIVLHNVRCSGRETALIECQHEVLASTNCSHDNDAGVSCLSVRLFGGRNAMEGRVEIFMRNEWGTICDTLWDSKDGNVVCRSLGYEGFTGVPRYNSFYGKGSGRIWLQNSSCNVDETSIQNCIKSGIWVHQCNHSNEAGVKCVPIRLVNGSSIDEGRVEVYQYNQWSTICGQNCSDSEAQVLCHSLGFGRAMNINATAFFGEGNGDILIQNVNCKGTESSLLDCGKDDVTVQNCSHHYDVGVKCSSVRLVNDTHEWEGLVEMYDGGAWKGLCAQNWNTAEARVACRSLGFDGSTAVTQPFKMNQRIKAKFPTYFDCRGHERNLFECSHHRIPVKTGWYSNDECTQAEVRCIPVRLSGGYSNKEGRVEVFMNNVWGTICDAGWDSVDTRIVCNTLFGYSYGGTKVSAGHFAQGVGDILLANVSCTGSESNVLECKHSLMTDHCTHSKDVAVKCYQNIRLNDGKLEVYVKNEWGTVCTYGWDDADAKVACRSLGLPSMYAKARTAYNYDRNLQWFFPGVDDENPSLLSSVGCRGTELSLFDCSSSSGSRYCYGSEIAAVDCA
nr:deleted in malignant brain tumors 1 protein-like isoform X2 [Crassostrea gigas]